MIRGLRAWSKGYADRGRYSPVGIAFHWAMAAMVLFQLGWGWHASRLPVGGDKLHAYTVHSAVGLPILVLAILRVWYRLIVPDPINDADRQGVQTTIAHAIHIVFYAAFFVLPLSGWVMWSAAVEPGPLYLAGFVPWPRLPVDDLPLTLRWALMEGATDVHLLFVTVLLVTVPLHAGAALKHHFWDRHDVLEGMLPEVTDEESPRPAPSRSRPKRSGRAPRSRPGTAAG